MGDAHPLGHGVWFTEVALREYSVRGVLLSGERQAFVWDTLSHPRDMAAFLPLITGRALTVAYSHADWDHIWGTGGLPHRGAVVLGHRSCLARFGDDAPTTLEEMRATEPGAWDAVELIAPNRVFDDEAGLDLGGMTVALSHLPGHTRDCCVAFVPEHGLLLIGDAAESPFPVLPPRCLIEQWIAGLKRWECDERVRRVVPAHGAIGGREILTGNIRYLRGLRDGHPVDVPAPLTDFYRATHESNLRVCGLGR